MARLRSLIHTRVNPAWVSFWEDLAAALERAADDGTTLCACDDGRRCVA